MQLYEDPNYGVYAADSLEEARRLLREDLNDNDPEVGAGMASIQNDKPITVTLFDDEDPPTEETATAKEWAARAHQKGYLFGGNE